MTDAHQFGKKSAILLFSFGIYATYLDGEQRKRKLFICRRGEKHARPISVFTQTRGSFGSGKLKPQHRWETRQEENTKP